MTDKNPEKEECNRHAETSPKRVPMRHWGGYAAAVVSSFILGGLVVFYIPQFVGGENSRARLDAWHETLRVVDGQRLGISRTGLNEKTNRIEIGMYPRRGAREKMEATLVTLDIPLEAIVIDVGCDGIRQLPLDVGEPTDEAFLRAIDYSLEIAPRNGEAMDMKLTLRNVSDEPVKLLLGGGPPYDFVVSTPDGKQVWHWKCAMVINDVMDSETLYPGEDLEFVGKWEQVDNRGEPVPPGSYFIRGVLNLGPREVLVTSPHELEVLR